MGQINSGSFLDETISGPSQEGSFLQGQFDPASGRTDYGAMDFAMNNTPYEYPQGLFDLITNPKQDEDMSDEDMRLYRPYSQETTASDDAVGMHTPEQIAEMKENIAAAKSLGYDKFTNPIADIMKIMIPGGSLMGSGYDAGTITPSGSIHDGYGNTFNPITGAKTSFSFSDIFGGDDNNISDAADSMGVSDGSMSGLMTVKGNNSIQDLLNSLGDDNNGGSNDNDMSQPNDSFSGGRDSDGWGE